MLNFDDCNLIPGPMHYTPPADISVDENLVFQLLEDQHPDLAGLPVRLLDTGWDNYMFRLGEEWLIRLPRRKMAVTLLKNEQQWLPLLPKSLPIPISAPYRIGVPGESYPWPWSIIPFFEGVTTDQEEPRSSQAKRFGAFLKALHQPAPANAPVNEYRGVPLAQRAVVTEKRMAGLQNKSKLVNSRLRKIWEEALSAAAAREAMWLHGDLHGRNVIVKDGIISGIVDWGDITSGDVATDLAATWMLFSDRSTREELLEVYGVADQATVKRAKGWAIFFGVILLDNGLADDERHARIGARVLERVMEE